MKPICEYCDQAGHTQQDCTEWARDEIAWLSWRAKQRKTHTKLDAVGIPLPGTATVPGRMTFTVLERK